MIKPVFLFILLLATTVTMKAQNLDQYERGAYVTKGNTLLYRILFPENFDASKKYPLVIVLHGSGERGDDNEAQLKHGGKLFLNDEVRQRFPSIVVFPQCARNSFWSNVEVKNDTSGTYTFKFKKVDSDPTKAMSALIGLLNRLSEKPFVDPRRIYVGGLSMGGMGAFELLGRKPKFFAAAFSIVVEIILQIQRNIKKYRSGFFMVQRMI